MIMTSGLKQDFMNKVTIYLTRNFVEPLYQLSKEKNYFTQVGTLAEIVDWSKEFCSDYHGRLTDWKSFISSDNHTSNAQVLEECILMFGKVRYKKFCAENAGKPTYFLEKYAAIEALVAINLDTSLL